MDVEYTELIKQEYAGNSCKISAGMVSGHTVDTVYLKLEKDDAEPLCILLRPDEMASIAWCCSGVIWSELVSKLDKSFEEDLNGK